LDIGIDNNGDGDIPRIRRFEATFGFTGYLLIGIAVMIVADAFLTYYGVGSEGIKESNPVIVWLIGIVGLGWAMVLKTIITGFFLLVMSYGIYHARVGVEIGISFFVVLVVFVISLSITLSNVLLLVKAWV